MQTRKQIQNGNFYGIFDYGNKTKRKLTRISKLSASNMNQKHLSFFFVVLKFDEQQEHKNEETKLETKKLFLWVFGL